MKQVQSEELETDFEREYAWGDDQRHFLNPKKKKASVFGYHLRFNAVIEAVKKFSPGKQVGDFASAQGNFALTLAELDFDVTAVDIHPEFLKYAKKKYSHGKFKTVLANIIEFDSPEKFDCVILGEIIEHVAHPDQLLKAAARNLKKGGVLVLTTPNGFEYGQPLPTFKQVTNIEELIPRQFHWGDHLFLYTENDLRELLEAQGFQVVQCVKLNSSYVNQLKAIRYIMPLKMLRWLDKKASGWAKKGYDSTNTIVVVARNS